MLPALGVASVLPGASSGGGRGMPPEYGWYCGNQIPRADQKRGVYSLSPLYVSKILGW